MTKHYCDRCKQECIPSKRIALNSTKDGVIDAQNFALDCFATFEVTLHKYTITCDDCPPDLCFKCFRELLLKTIQSV